MLKEKLCLIFCINLTRSLDFIFKKSAAIYWLPWCGFGHYMLKQSLCIQNSEKWKYIYCLCVSVMLTFWVLCQLASKCFKLTDHTQQVLPHSYLMQINQSYAIIRYFQQILIKILVKKSDVYHMHVHLLVHAVNWSVLFIRTCGLSSTSARQTSLLCLVFLLLYSVLLSGLDL